MSGMVSGLLTEGKTKIKSKRKNGTPDVSWEAGFVHLTFYVSGG